MADDEYDPDVLDDDQTQDDDGTVYDVTKERIIALIDADKAMLETLAEGDEERPYMSWAVDMATGIMQDRIRTSPRDEFGIIFYSTTKSNAGADRTFEHCQEYLPLEVPSARTIRRLAAFNADEFEEECGCSNVAASPGLAAENLRYGLWACWDMFTRAGGSTTSSGMKQQSRVAKTVLLFTNNSNPLEGAANPSHLKDQLDNRAQELGGLAVHIEVLPLVQLTDPSAFDHSTFWAPLLAEARAIAKTMATIGAGGDDGNDTSWDDAEALMDETEDIESKILRVKGLGLRSTGNRKRPLDAMTWSLSPQFQVAVKLYGLVMPAKKPHHTYVTAAAHDEVSKTRAYIDADTGAMLTAVTYRSFEADARQGAERFPKVVMRNEEIASLKNLRPKGLVLLGFKPVSCLRDYHTLSPSRFVYPDERSLRGSTAAFAALHAACLADEDDPQMAVCSYVTRTNAMPVLVALLPQPEELDGDEQVVPPGFHLVPLPFKDDIRQPESDPALVSRVTAAGGRSGPPRANREQVAAAVAMINALSIDGVDEDGNPAPFSSTEIANAALERHFQVLEALALDEEVPDKAELEDDTEPDVLGMSRHRTTLDAFKLAVFGSVEGAPEKQKSGGTKRKTDDPDAKKAIAEEYAEHDWAALGAPGAKKGLTSLTIPTLKIYLQHHGLKLTGNKGEIVQRIQEHLQKGGGS